MKAFWVDLHIHTVLSPCGELDMGASEIVEKAREANLDVIAITDHNSVDNWEAVANAAKGNPIVIPGLEVQTAEDVHMLCLFEYIDTAIYFKNWLWQKMPKTLNDPDIFGHQVIIDSENKIIAMEEILLVQGVGQDIDTIIKHVHSLSGLAILAHVDRPSFSYPAHLGPIPKYYPVDAIELSSKTNYLEAYRWREEYPEKTFIRSSDSHTLATIQRQNATKMMLLSPTFSEIRLALANTDGRRTVWPWG